MIGWSYRTSKTGLLVLRIFKLLIYKQFACLYQEAAFDGKLSIEGNMQSFGRLDLLSLDTSLYVSDTVELAPSNQLHVAVPHSEEGTTKPSISAGNTLIAQGDLVVHFHEDWKKTCSAQSIVQMSVPAKHPE